MAGDIGFERKLMQQGFAKGVDGLDFQPAWCFQCARKQPPCFRQNGARRRFALYRLDFAGECRIV